jgi:hypothetical protein
VAAVVTGFEASSHDVGLDVGFEASLGFDVEINVYGGLDGDTSALIENAKRAAEKLRHEYGVEVIVSPNIINWDIISINFTPYNLPVLVVNGIQVAEGRVLSVDEIVNIVLEVLDKRSRESPLAINGKLDDLVEVAACTW